MEPERLRRLAWGGAVGPAAFIGAWAVGSAVRDGYDPVEQAISRLAETGSPTRTLMTAGFLTFAAGVASASPAIGRFLSRPAGMAAAITALATAGVAATPLDGDASNPAHAAFAITGYVTLAAIPLLSARPLRRAGHRRWAASALFAGMLAAASLATTTADRNTGLFQRAGLTAGDLWLIAASTAVARGRLDLSRTAAPPRSGGSTSSTSPAPPCSSR